MNDLKSTDGKKNLYRITKQIAGQDVAGMNCNLKVSQTKLPIMFYTSVESIIFMGNMYIGHQSFSRMLDKKMWKLHSTNLYKYSTAVKKQTIITYPQISRTPINFFDLMLVNSDLFSSLTIQLYSCEQMCLARASRETQAFKCYMHIK